MALKRKTKMIESFSLASMTDIIFLLLIFFMVTSTLIVPNAIKVNLPSTEQIKPQEVPPLRIDITKEQHIFVEIGRNAPIEVSESRDLASILEKYSQENPQASAAVYADEEVPYSSVISIIDQVTKVDLKLILVTNPK